MGAFEVISPLEYPTPVLHIDCDAFFTSVEQALNPALAGRPVATGKERGIIACASYEARARGVKRPMRMKEALKVCPGLVCLESDYETYSVFSKKFFSILRRFTPVVEEYSIDEAFAELSGLRRLHRKDFPGISKDIKDTIQKELGITVSAGLSASKTLAKIASQMNKPDGFTELPANRLHHVLKNVPLSQVPGFGPGTRALLLKFGIGSAYTFVRKDPAWIEKLLGKTGKELYLELRGEAVYGLVTEEKSRYASIMKCRSFSPPSDDLALLRAVFAKNLEGTFEKMRRFKIKARSFFIFVRDRDFQMTGIEAELLRASDCTLEGARMLLPLFDKLILKGMHYRQTGISAFDFLAPASRQYDLFEDRESLFASQALDRAADTINVKYGRSALALGSGLFLKKLEKKPDGSVPPAERNAVPGTGEKSGRRLNIPLWTPPGSF